MKLSPLSAKVAGIIRTAFQLRMLFSEPLDVGAGGLLLRGQQGIRSCCLVSWPEAI